MAQLKETDISGSLTMYGNAIYLRDGDITGSYYKDTISALTVPPVYEIIFNGSDTYKNSTLARIIKSHDKCVTLTGGTDDTVMSGLRVDENNICLWSGSGTKVFKKDATNNAYIDFSGRYLPLKVADPTGLLADANKVTMYAKNIKDSSVTHDITAEYPTAKSIAKIFVNPSSSISSAQLAMYPYLRRGETGIGHLPNNMYIYSTTIYIETRVSLLTDAAYGLRKGMYFDVNLPYLSEVYSVAITPISDTGENVIGKYTAFASGNTFNGYFPYEGYMQYGGVDKITVYLQGGKDLSGADPKNPKGGGFTLVVMAKRK